MKKTRTVLFPSLAASDTLFLPYISGSIDPFLLSEIEPTVGKEGTLLLPMDTEANRLYASGKKSFFFVKDTFSPLEKMLTLSAKVIDGKELFGATLLVRLAVSRFFERRLSEEADTSLFENGENGAPLFPTPDPSLLLAKLTEERKVEEVTLHEKKWFLYTATDLVHTADILFEKDPAAYFGNEIASLLKAPDGEKDGAETPEGRAFLAATLPPRLFDVNLSVNEADTDPLSLTDLIGAREALWLRTDELPDLIFDRNRITALHVNMDMPHRAIEEGIDADLHTACIRLSLKEDEKEGAFKKDALLPYLMKLAHSRSLALYIEGLTDEEDFAKLCKLYKKNRKTVLLLPLAGLMKQGMPPKALIKLSKEKRVYFDITAVNDPMSLALFANLFGIDKLLFGSGGKIKKNLYAFCRTAADLRFTEGEIAKILCENAEKIFLS